MHACTHIIKESKSSNDGKIDYGPRGKVVEKKKGMHRILIKLVRFTVQKF